MTEIRERARAEWSDIRADPDTAIRREKWAVWANTTGVQLMDALETLQAENERLEEALAKIAGTDHHGTEGYAHEDCIAIARAALGAKP